jgi:hypothetical protein
MDAQVVNEGRHQGGRAPYGYVVVDGGPHPNPRKAAEGFRLRQLAIAQPQADVVQRIFVVYLDGNGDRAIAGMLNREGVPCPSAERPDQNRHRLADGWQGSTVRSILDNPRYTGYAVFGRWARHETLLDPAREGEDVGDVGGGVGEGARTGEVVSHERCSFSGVMVRELARPRAGSPARRR